MDKLNWAVLGTGVVANQMAQAMLDIGVYAISLARCFLKSKPDNVISTVKFAPSGVDEMSGIVMTN